jgi:hypothetical protein
VDSANVSPVGSNALGQKATPDAVDQFFMAAAGIT